VVSGVESISNLSAISSGVALAKSEALCDGGSEIKNGSSFPPKAGFCQYLSLHLKADLIFYSKGSVVV